ncbi:MAG: hypothetical protein GF381_01040 [Candidatus Pacebacteria bacterium]|nr:hypothetical protein [Candidatus Paceibacterota bacterium]
MNQNTYQDRLYQPKPDLQLSEHFFETPIPGLLYFSSTLFSDKRGFFSEVVKLPELEQVLDHKFEIKQVNHARSQDNVIRGIHAEGWNKLVTVICGKAFSALVDLRPESETYKKVVYFQLGADQEKNICNGLYIPQGLGNSVAVLEGPLSYVYLVDKLYQERDPAGDQAISLFDPQLAIEWPIKRNEMILSERDQSGVGLEEK